MQDRTARLLEAAEADVPAKEAPILFPPHTPTVFGHMDCNPVFCIEAAFSILEDEQSMEEDWQARLDAEDYDRHVWTWLWGY